MPKQKYETVKTMKCAIRDRDETYMSWYAEEELYVIYNGKKYGLMYNQKSRSYPDESPQYDVILRCKWDYLQVVQAENGTYVVAFSGKTCNLFWLLGSKKIIEENNKVYKNIFYITAKKPSIKNS